DKEEIEEQLKIGSVTEIQEKQLKQLLEKYRTICSTEGKIGTTSIIEHEINTGDHVGWIRISKGPWSLPVVMVKKKDGEIRFCVDYRKINAITKQMHTYYQELKNC